jgi:hypothetical protein
VRTVFEFKSRRNKRKCLDATTETRTSPVRLARLMALAILFEEMLARGEVADHAELARRYGVAGAQISRIMMLNLLAPKLQGKLLEMAAPSEDFTLKTIMPIGRCTDWRRQEELFAALRVEGQ